ncbi:MAG: PhoU domain-containing protein, partial [Planctomycetaceae bacterium]|nr:PhoU domain-containing protein [Planctomycetaceae bacterium]
ERAIRALVSNDLEAAKEVADAKQEVNRLSAEAERHLSRRLAADEPNRLAMFRLESELMEYIKRMYYFAKRIAKLVIEEDLNHVQTPEEEETRVQPAENAAV